LRSTRPLNGVARRAVGDQIEGRKKEHWFVRALVAIPPCSAGDTDIQIIEFLDGIIDRADPRLRHHGVEWNDSRSNARRSGGPCDSSFKKRLRRDSGPENLSLTCF
jgi:hypothetical protein